MVRSSWKLRILVQAGVGVGLTSLGALVEVGVAGSKRGEDTPPGAVGGINESGAFARGREPVQPANNPHIQSTRPSLKLVKKYPVSCKKPS
jgi:hypothetical protein